MREMIDAISDIDECNDNVCEQNCENTPGSFKCKCWDNYLTRLNGGCQGLLFLLFSDC